MSKTTEITSALNCYQKDCIYPINFYNKQNANVSQELLPLFSTKCSPMTYGIFSTSKTNEKFNEVSTDKPISTNCSLSSCKRFVQSRLSGQLFFGTKILLLEKPNKYLFSDNKVDLLLFGDILDLRLWQ